MPYYDFISITKDLKNDKFCDKYLHFIREINYRDHNIIQYALEHQNTQMNVLWNPLYNQVQINGSLPYFLFGHNFNIAIEQERHIIEYLSIVTGTNLFKSTVDTLEYGGVFKIPFTVKDILNSHIKIPGMKTQTYDYGKYFIDGINEFKLYDFQKNFKKKVSRQIREEVKEIHNYLEEDFYIKIETRYLKPEVSLKKRNILVETIFDEKFINQCNTNLTEKYASIKKLGSVEIKSKKQLTSASLALIALELAGKQYGFDVGALMTSVIKAYPGVLTKDDKKARMKQLKSNLKKIQTIPCEYDISELIRQAILS